MKNGEPRIRRIVVTTVAATVAAATLAACTPSEEKPPTVAAKPTDVYFGPAEFGKLRIGMTEAEALASGDLADQPVATIGCKEYSFRGGPVADQKRLDEDAKIEKEADDLSAAAQKINDEADRLGKKKNKTLNQVVESADKYAAAADASAKSAEASARSAERSAQRTEEFVKAGGASFGSGVLRMVMAPPKAKTAEGIERGSPLASVKAAYEVLGLKAEEGRWSVPVPNRPGWNLSFDIEQEKVTAMLFWNSTVKCS